MLKTLLKWLLLLDIWDFFMDNFYKLLLVKRNLSQSVNFSSTAIFDTSELFKTQMTKGK